MPTGFEFYVVTRSYSSRLFLFTFAFGYKGCYYHRQYTYGDQVMKLQPKEYYVKRKVICYQVHVLRIHIIGGH